MEREPKGAFTVWVTAAELNQCYELLKFPASEWHRACFNEHPQ